MEWKNILDTILNIFVKSTGHSFIANIFLVNNVLHISWNCSSFLNKWKKGWICVSITLLFVCAHICRHASHQDRAESVGLHSFHQGWSIASQVTISSDPGNWEKEVPLWVSIKCYMHACVFMYAQVCACECMVVVKLWASQAEPPPSSVPGLVWVRIPQTFGNSQRSWWGAGWPRRSGGLQSLASPCDSPDLGTGPWADPAYSYTPICFLFIWALSYTRLKCLTAGIDIRH